ncbi:hypothetical protein [Rhizohabitans arisaemae]|uniref:hypothetical protein n=1 Tax=Rhizohabitans arisaemae TaxID=2720610 RepID=UPI0024B0E2D7|nr:hypothetical protein [Rhizohabitans arisaemae]
MSITYPVLLILAIYFIVLFGIPRSRAFFSRHRLLTSLLPLPIAALVLVAFDQWERIEPDTIVVALLAYVNGLVAFALVVGIQDLRRARRDRGSG